MTNLSFSAPLTIRAGKQRRFAILAYSGGLMNVGGFDLPVVVDLAGLETPATLPIVSDHELTLEATLGIAHWWKTTVGNCGCRVRSQELPSGLKAFWQWLMRGIPGKHRSESW